MAGGARAAGGAGAPGAREQAAHPGRDAPLRAVAPLAGRCGCAGAMGGVRGRAAQPQKRPLCASVGDLWRRTAADEANKQRGWCAALAERWQRAAGAARRTGAAAPRRCLLALLTAAALALCALPRTAAPGAGWRCAPGGAPLRCALAADAAAAALAHLALLLASLALHAPSALLLALALLCAGALLLRGAGRRVRHIEQMRRRAAGAAALLAARGERAGGALLKRGRAASSHWLLHVVACLAALAPPAAVVAVPYTTFMTSTQFGGSAGCVQQSSNKCVTSPNGYWGLRFNSQNAAIQLFANVNGNCNQDKGVTPGVVFVDEVNSNGFSCTANCCLCMQGDGNVVMYDACTGAANNGGFTNNNGPKAALVSYYPMVDVQMGIYLNDQGAAYTAYQSDPGTVVGRLKRADTGAAWADRTPPGGWSSPPPLPPPQLPASITLPVTTATGPLYGLCSSLATIITNKPAAGFSAGGWSGAVKCAGYSESYLVGDVGAYGQSLACYDAAGNQCGPTSPSATCPCQYPASTQYNTNQAAGYVTTYASNQFKRRLVHVRRVPTGTRAAKPAAAQPAAAQPAAAQPTAAQPAARAAAAQPASAQPAASASAAASIAAFWRCGRRGLLCAEHRCDEHCDGSRRRVRRVRCHHWRGAGVHRPVRVVRQHVEWLACGVRHESSRRVGHPRMGDVRHGGQLHSPPGAQQRLLRLLHHAGPLVCGARLQRRHPPRGGLCRVVALAGAANILVRAGQRHVLPAGLPGRS
jgi:hypothetical protein